MTELSEPVYARAPNIVSTEVDGKFVLLKPEDWTYLEFDDIGDRIWARLNEPLTVTCLVNLLLREYLSDAETCMADTERFLRDLADRGFATLV
jgi:hypothetical protein